MQGMYDAAESAPQGIANMVDSVAQTTVSLVTTAVGYTGYATYASVVPAAYH